MEKAMPEERHPLRTGGFAHPFFKKRDPLLNDFELKYIYIDIPLSIYVYFFCFSEQQPSSSDQRKV